MSQAACLFRLVAMRRRAGASLPQAMVWALGLLWRNYRASKRRTRCSTEPSASIRSAP